MRRMIGGSVAVGLALTCLAGPAHAQGGPGGKVYTVGKEPLKIEGHVDATGNKVEVFRAGNPRRALPLPAKVYSLKLAGGGAYRLDLASDEIHSFLVLQDEDGKQVAADDNSAGKLNAQVSFTAPRDGTYKVFAATLRGAGKFTLTVRQEAVAAVREVGTGLKINDTLSATTISRVYLVKLVQGKTYVIDMTSPNLQALDPFLRLLDASGKQLAFNDDIDLKANNLNAQIIFQAPATATYQIVATSFMNSGKGPYTLEVRER